MAESLEDLDCRIDTLRAQIRQALQAQDRERARVLHTQLRESERAWHALAEQAEHDDEPAQRPARPGRTSDVREAAPGPARGGELALGRGAGAARLLWRFAANIPGALRGDQLDPVVIAEASRAELGVHADAGAAARRTGASRARQRLDHAQQLFGTRMGRASQAGTSALAGRATPLLTAARPAALSCYRPKVTLGTDVHDTVHDTEARLARIRAEVAPRSHNASAIAALAGNPGCARRAVMDAAGVQQRLVRPASRLAQDNAWTLAAPAPGVTVRAPVEAKARSPSTRV